MIELKARWLGLALAVFLLACGGLPQDHEERGDHYSRIGSHEDALAEYLMAQKTDGANLSLLQKIGRVYVMKGDFFQAKKYYDRYYNASNSKPDHAVLLDYFKIALERAAAGDTTTMVQALEEILQLDSSFELGRYFFDMGEFYFRQGDYRRAVSCFQRGLPLRVEEDHRPLHLFHLALSYEKLNDGANAFLYFDQFVTLYPDREEADEARWHRGSCCYPLAEQLFREQHDSEGAIFYLDQIIQAGQPQHLLDDAWYLQGEILLAAERIGEARRAYQQVLEANRYTWKEKVAEEARKRLQEIEVRERIRQ